MKNYLLTLLLILSISSCFGQINSVYDWDKVKIFDEEEIDSVKSLSKLDKITITLPGAYKRVKNLESIGLKVLKLNVAMSGGCAGRVINTDYQGDAATYLFGGQTYYKVFAAIYQCGTKEITLDKFNSIAKGAKTFSIVEKQTIANDLIIDKSIKTNIKLKNTYTDENGLLYITANVPTEWNDKFKVTFIGEETITIYDFQNSTSYLIKPIL